MEGAAVGPGHTPRRFVEYSGETSSRTLSTSELGHLLHSPPEEAFQSIGTPKMPSLVGGRSALLHLITQSAALSVMSSCFSISLRTCSGRIDGPVCCLRPSAGLSATASSLPNRQVSAMSRQFSARHRRKAFWRQISLACATYPPSRGGLGTLCSFGVVDNHAMAADQEPPLVWWRMIGVGIWFGDCPGWGCHSQRPGSGGHRGWDEHRRSRQRRTGGGGALHLSLCVLIPAFLEHRYNTPAEWIRSSKSTGSMWFGCSTLIFARRLNPLPRVGG